MAVIKVPTNFNIDVEFEIPEFYRRLLSLIIDMTFQYFYLILAGAIYTSAIRNSDGGIDSMYDISALRLLLLLPIMIYHIVMEITTNGQSIGKKIMNIRVVMKMEDGPVSASLLYDGCFVYPTFGFFG